MNRKDAILHGAITYDGKPHICGTTLKYTKHRNCVECHRCKLQYQIKRRQDRYYTLRLEILQHYSKSEIPYCNCCHETIFQFLQLDHINNDGNLHRRTLTKPICSWIKENNFPPIFQVLCVNCNFGKSINGGICPHVILRKTCGK